MLRVITVGLLAAVAALVVPQLAHAAPAARPAASHSAHNLLNMVNRDRAAAGLPRLTFDQHVASVALAHSLDMAEHGYLSHNTPSGATPYNRMIASGIRYRVAGENIGYDSGAGRHAMLQAIEAAMLQSPEHRANLLRGSFRAVGIGIALAGDKIYVTEDFTG